MREEKKFRLMTQALRKLTPSPLSFVPPKNIALLLNDINVCPNTGTGVSGRLTGNHRTFSNTAAPTEKKCKLILRKHNIRRNSNLSFFRRSYPCFCRSRCSCQCYSCEWYCLFMLQLLTIFRTLWWHPPGVKVASNHP